MNQNIDNSIDYELKCYRCGRISDIEDLICEHCGALVGKDTILNV